MRLNKQSDRLNQGLQINLREGFKNTKREDEAKYFNCYTTKEVLRNKQSFTSY